MWRQLNSIRHDDCAWRHNCRRCHAQARGQAAIDTADGPGRHRPHPRHRHGRRRGRHGDRELRRCPLPGRQGVRQQLRPWPAAAGDARSRSGHQGLGRRSGRNQARRPPPARHPGGAGLRRQAAQHGCHPAGRCAVVRRRRRSSDSQGRSGRRSHVTVPPTPNQTTQTFTDLIVGTGADIKPGQTVAVHLLAFSAADGKQLDSSWESARR